jgi:hypothetical protein
MNSDAGALSLRSPREEPLDTTLQLDVDELVDVRR